MYQLYFNNLKKRYYGPQITHTKQHSARKGVRTTGTQVLSIVICPCSLSNPILGGEITEGEKKIERLSETVGLDFL